MRLFLQDNSFATSVRSFLVRFFPVFYTRLAYALEFKDIYCQYHTDKYERIHIEDTIT